MQVIIFILGGIFSISMLYAGMRIEQSRTAPTTITIKTEDKRSENTLQDLWRETDSANDKNRADQALRRRRML